MQPLRIPQPRRAPVEVARAVTDAGTFFGIELPSLMEWELRPEQAAAFTGPVLSVIGTDTDPVWVEVDELLHAWFPQLEEVVVHGVGHLLQLQRPEPIARGLAEFLARHPILDSAPAQRHDARRAPIHA